jgi:hypothetical protein
LDTLDPHYLLLERIDFSVTRRVEIGVNGGIRLAANPWLDASNA